MAGRRAAPRRTKERDIDELVDVRDEAGLPTGRVVWKSEAHRRGLWHRCFHCWVFGAGSAPGPTPDPYLLVQRRAATKETWPGYLDVTAGGHLAAGEEGLDGRRELEEELGLRAAPERLAFLGTRRMELAIPAGTDREFYDVYLLRDETDPQDLRLQREEVEAVVRLRFEDIAGLLETGSAPAREYPEGEPFDTRIGLDELVPHMGDYLRTVPLAARQVLAGVRAGEVF